jgi:predicted SnoaL-like aldol condensation-catalyzing enzyme
MPRGRTAIPTTQPTNHRKKAPGAEHAKDNIRTEQGDRSQSLRYSLQQTRLRSSRTLLVAEVHPAQLHIAPGREGLFALIRSAPDTLRYENQRIVAEGDYVIAHGRFSGNGRPAAWIVADIVRFEDGLLAEHWDVLQDEATQEESVSGIPMFGDRFPS